MIPAEFFPHILNNFWSENHMEKREGFIKECSAKKMTN